MQRIIKSTWVILYFTILLQEIAKLTPSRLFGFGGFREKPTPPFDSYRSYAFDFEHYFKLNDDIDEFVRQVNAASRKGVVTMDQVYIRTPNPK